MNAVFFRPSFLIRPNLYTAFTPPDNQDFPDCLYGSGAKTLPTYSNSILIDVWPKWRHHGMTWRSGRSSVRKRLPPREPPPGSPQGNLSAGHAALIEAVYRAIYLLATINREQLIEAGLREDIDGIVEEAWDAMAQTMKEGIH